jgi:hypothetical protein
MKKYVRLSILAFIAINVSLLTGCQSMWTSGPRYSTVKTSLTPEPGNGLVLIYAKSGFWGGGPNKWKIFANDKLLTEKFHLATFYSYQADPGELRLSTKKNNPIISATTSHINIREMTLQIKPNQTYYIESGFWGGGMVTVDFMVFKQVSQEEAEKGIKGCKWINHP